MKVVLIGNADSTIGIYRYELLQRLIKEGHQVTVISPNGDYVPNMIELGCHHYIVNVDRHGTNPIKDFELILKYVKLLRNIKPDMVFSYTIKPNIYGAIACRILNIPIVVNVTGLGTAVENKGWKQAVTLMLYRFSFQKVQTIFFQNEENMKFFRDRNLFVKKHKLLPGSGVNLNRFVACDYPAGETIDFVFVSRLMKEKGIDQYLEAAQYITQKYPNTRFHICGFCEKEYESKLEKLKTNPAIIYHGMVKDMTTILPKMNCTVHPTYYPEGLSNVLLESLATARPIITTDRAGCREVVDDGVNGFIVNQQDSADLISKIEKFLSLSYEEQKQMGLAGRAKVEKEFDREIVVDKYIKEIED